MVNLTIDGKQISVKENTTIMEAADQNGITIPSLCYLKGINEIAACRVCVVELEGKERLITACNNVAEEGMVVYTNSPKVRNHRRNTVELILSQHDCLCVTCPRSATAVSRRLPMTWIFWRSRSNESWSISLGTNISRLSATQLNVSNVCAVFRSATRYRG